MSSNNRGISPLDAVFQEYIVNVDGQRRLEVDVDGRRHTVELRDPLPFELDLVNDIIEPSIDNSISGNAVPIKGKWIEGWLTANEDDYINNIFKQYQYFIKYLEARTSTIKNIQTYQRSPGTYDSMYRYIILLEELGLVERHRREEVPEDEYDFPVPEEFRTRTYVKKTADYEDRKDAWDNPYTAEYGEPEETTPSEQEVDEVDVEPESEDEEDDAVEIDVKPRDDDEQPEGLDEFVNPQETESVDVDLPDESSEGLDSIEEPQPDKLPDTGASITQFPQKDQLYLFIKENFDDAVADAIDNAPIPIEDVEQSDFSLGRVAVFGVWAEGNATVGESKLSLVVSIDDTKASTSPGFVPAGVQTSLEDILNQQNPFTEVFPSYDILGVYNSAFASNVDEVVRKTQSKEQYYDLGQEKVVEL